MVSYRIRRREGMGKTGSGWDITAVEGSGIIRYRMIGGIMVGPEDGCANANAQGIRGKGKT